MANQCQWHHGSCFHRKALARVAQRLSELNSMNANDPSTHQKPLHLDIEAISQAQTSIDAKDAMVRRRDGSVDINQGATSDVTNRLRLGSLFAERLQTLTGIYVDAFGDNSHTRRRAMSEAIDFVARHHRVSTSTVRLYIQAHNKFHTIVGAPEHLRLTDMQLLLPNDIGHDIVEAVIQMRMADPGISTREVKRVIGAMRQHGPTCAAPVLTPPAFAAP